MFRVRDLVNYCCCCDSLSNLLPGIDVAHAFFKYKPHSGHDGGAVAAPLLRGGAGKRPVGGSATERGLQGDELAGAVLRLYLCLRTFFRNRGPAARCW